MMNDSLQINASDVLLALTPGVTSSALPGIPGRALALRLDRRTLITSATMFAVGVLGNLVAVVVLCVSKKEQKETTFYTLVCGMAITDLLGTCFTSPVVIATYVVGRWPGGALLCHFFSFSMLFFCSAGMSILCAMSVERYLAISHAYFYSQHVDRGVARLTLLAAYLINAALCLMPSFGFGRHVKHFPGTWCFLDWRALDALAASYSFLYGGFMLVLVAVTVLCNFAVCRSLVSMSKKTRVVVVGGGGTSRRMFPKLASVTSAAEIQMFWLLIFMTSVFLVCSIPLVVRIFVNQLYGPTYLAAGIKPDYRNDLLAIRFASFNPILDPWVYILCRKNLFTKGCERIKRSVGLSRERHARASASAWTGSQHSPPSFARSNDTSYASLHLTACRSGEDDRVTANCKSYVDLTRRQAWEFDAAMDNFHPFSIEQHPVLGFERQAASPAKPVAATVTTGRVQITSSTQTGTKMHESKVEIVTCTFSTPSSCLSEKSIT